MFEQEENKASQFNLGEKIFLYWLYKYFLLVLALSMGSRRVVLDGQ